MFITFQERKNVLLSIKFYRLDYEECEDFNIRPYLTNFFRSKTAYIIETSLLGKEVHKKSYFLSALFKAAERENRIYIVQNIYTDTRWFEVALLEYVYSNQNSPKYNRMKNPWYMLFNRFKKRLFWRTSFLMENDAQFLLREYEAICSKFKWKIGNASIRFNKKKKLI